MKLPVVIQHHPLGYVCHIPEAEFEEMKKTSKPTSKEDIIKRFTLKKEFSEMSQSSEIPEKWRKPVKAYSGIVYGVYSGNETISAEADTIPELLDILKAKAKEIEIGFPKSAREDWPSNYSITEIEI